MLRLSAIDLRLRLAVEILVQTDYLMNRLSMIRRERTADTHHCELIVAVRRDDFESVRIVAEDTDSPRVLVAVVICLLACEEVSITVNSSMRQW